MRSAEPKMNHRVASISTDQPSAAISDSSWPGSYITLITLNCEPPLEEVRFRFSSSASGELSTTVSRSAVSAKRCVHQPVPRQFQDVARRPKGVQRGFNRCHLPLPLAKP